MKKFVNLKWKNVNFTAKILLSNIIIIVIIFVLTGMLIYQDVYDRLYETEEFLAAEAFENVTNHFSKKHNVVFEQYTSMHRFDNIADAFKKIDRGEMEPYDLSVIQLTNNYCDMLMTKDLGITDVILVGPKNCVFSRSADENRVVSARYPFHEYALAKKAMESTSNILIEIDPNPPYLAESGQPVISYIGKIYDLDAFFDNRIIGYFIINFSIEEISSQFRGYSESLISDIYYLSEDNQILFSTEESTIGTVFNEEAAKQDVIQSKIVDASGSRMIMKLDTTKPIRYIREVRQYFTLMLFLGVALLVGVTIILHKTFRKKLDKIANTMTTAQHSNFSIRLPVEGNDEIGQLSTSYNLMCDHLQQYIQLNYIAETQKKLALINALQAQINPHFLYNTIDSIREKAISEDNNRQEQVSEMLVMLSRLFRYCADFNESFVFLEDEIGYVEDYLELQQMRFGEDFDYEISIPYELSYMGVPKLILQPLIENAIVHGLRGVNHRHLKISAYKENTCLKIVITDNGCGISAAELERLNEHTEGRHAEPGNRSGIGVKNVHNRINMLFGGDSGVVLSSELGKGTTVCVTLPALGKEDMQKCIE